MAVADFTQVCAVIAPPVHNGKAFQRFHLIIVFYLEQVHVCNSITNNLIGRNHFTVNFFGQAFLTVDHPLKLMPACTSLCIGSTPCVVFIRTSGYTSSIMGFGHVINIGGDNSVIEKTKRIALTVDAESKLRLVSAAVGVIIPCGNSHIGDFFQILGRISCRAAHCGSGITTIHRSSVRMSIYIRRSVGKLLISLKAVHKHDIFRIIVAYFSRNLNRLAFLRRIAGLDGHCSVCSNNYVLIIRCIFYSGNGIVIHVFKIYACTFALCQNAGIVFSEYQLKFLGNILRCRDVLLRLCCCRFGSILFQRYSELIEPVHAVLIRQASGYRRLILYFIYCNSNAISGRCRCFCLDQRQHCRFIRYVSLRYCVKGQSFYRFLRCVYCFLISCRVRGFHSDRGADACCLRIPCSGLQDVHVIDEVLVLDELHDFLLIAPVGGHTCLGDALDSCHYQRFCLAVQAHRSSVNVQAGPICRNVGFHLMPAFASHDICLVPVSAITDCVGFHIFQTLIQRQCTSSCTLIRRCGNSDAEQQVRIVVDYHSKLNLIEIIGR